MYLDTNTNSVSKKRYKYKQKKGTYLDVTSKCYVQMLHLHVATKYTKKTNMA